jgi:hypothetical protein
MNSNKNNFKKQKKIRQKVTNIKVLRALKPTGPSVSVKLRSAGVLTSSVGGVVTNCVSLGTIAVGLADFASLAAVFTRFTITRARLTIMPAAGFINGVTSIRYPISIGYFND